MVRKRLGTPALVKSIDVFKRFASVRCSFQFCRLFQK